MRRDINALGTKLGDKGINIAALNFRRHAAQGEAVALVVGDDPSR